MLASLFLLGAIGFTAASKFTHKYVLKEVSSYSYALFQNLISGIIFLPLALSTFHMSSDQRALPILVISGALWTLSSVMSFMSIKGADLSLREPIAQTKILFVLAFGILFLHESFTIPKVLGTVIIFIGLSIILFRKGNRWGSLKDPGVLITFLSALVAASAAIFDKYSLQYFSPETYGLFTYFIPFFFLSFGLAKKKIDVVHLLRNKWRRASLGALLSVLGYYCVLKTYQHIALTIAYPLLQLSTVLIVLGGIFIFKENISVRRKILATVVILVGVVLLKFA